MRGIGEMTTVLPLAGRPRIERILETATTRMEFACRMPFWSLHFFHYEAGIDIGEQNFILRPGQALLTPPHVRTYSRYYGGHSMYYTHFYLDAHGASKETATAPLILDMQDDYDRLNAVFAGAIRAQSVSQTKAEIGLWYLLQELYGARAEGQEKELPEKLALALRVIADSFPHLDGVEELADRVGLCARHLNRIFKEHFNISAPAFLREKRLQEARKYLETSDYMIKEIGALVGLPDQQYFCHMIRKRFGRSPQQLRMRPAREKN